MLLGTCRSYGSPSSHTQCMFFALAMYAGLQLMSTKGRDPDAGSAVLDDDSVRRRLKLRRAVGLVIGAVETVCLAAASAAVAWSRVYLTYHSVDQVREV